MTSKKKLFVNIEKKTLINIIAVSEDVSERRISLTAAASILVLKRANTEQAQDGSYMELIHVLISEQDSKNL